MAASTSTLPAPDHLSSFAPTTNIAVPAAGARRKTPSELRQEQLNRAVRSRNSQDGTSSAAFPSTGSTAEQQRKTYLRLVDTYAATKPHGTRPKVPFSEQKDDFHKGLPNGSIETSQISSKPVGEEEPCPPATAKDVLPANECNSVAAEQQSGKFRDVTQLSCKTRPQASGTVLDMAEALKVMAPAAGRGFSGISVGPATASQLPAPSSLTRFPASERSSTPSVDLSLKLSARFLSVDSLHWCHSLSSMDEVEGVKLFVEKVKWKDKADLGGEPHVVLKNGRQDRFGAQFCQALHSWVHPPPQFWELFELAIVGARGDAKKSGIITTHFRAWEDSFRSLYYMFCHKHCNTFYLCTQQSVVMFKRGNSVEGNDSGSYAYLSRSTRGLRKKLQEQGVEFLMPFYTSDADMSILEDLHELTEFEKLHPGQTRLVDSSEAIDNNSQSLLVFEVGNVHRLFDVLLNYRFLVASGSATDLPVLYSPVEFSKASLYTPEVRYKRLQSAVENISKELPTQNRSIMRSTEKVSAIVHSIELKGPPGSYITPWVVQAVCSVLQQSQNLGFEASFVTGPLSETLNVAHDALSSAREVGGQESKASSSSRTYVSDVSSSKMKVIKHLRYSEGFYQANTGGSL